MTHTLQILTGVFIPFFYFILFYFILFIVQLFHHWNSMKYRVNCQSVTLSMVSDSIDDLCALRRSHHTSALVKTGTGNGVKILLSVQPSPW